MDGESPEEQSGAEEEPQVGVETKEPPKKSPLFKIAMILIGVIILIMGFAIGGGAMSLMAEGEPAPEYANEGGQLTDGCGIPADYLAVFNEATEWYSSQPRSLTKGATTIPTALLASVFWAGEHVKNPWSSLPMDGPWASSGSDARGPFQIIEGTWRQYGFGWEYEKVQDINYASKVATNILSQNYTVSHGNEEKKVKDAIIRYNPNYKNTDPEYVNRVYEQYLIYQKCMTYIADCGQKDNGTGEPAVIVIDPGHPGDGNGGAAGKPEGSENLISEREIVYGISLKLESQLSQMGYRVINTKKEFAREKNLKVDFNNVSQMADVGQDPELTNVHRAEIANANNASYTLRLHNNGGKNTSGKFFIWWLKGKDGDKNVLNQGMAITKTLFAQMDSTLGPMKKGNATVEGKDLLFSKASTRPAGLIELGGLNNGNGKYSSESRKDVSYLSSDKGQLEIAISLAQGIKAAVPVNGGSAGDTNCNVVDIALAEAKKDITDYHFKNANDCTIYNNHNPINPNSPKPACEQWCSNFVTWVYKKAGYPIDQDKDFTIGSMAGTPTLMDFFRKKHTLLEGNEVVVSKIKPGDVVFVRNNQSNSGYHSGIVRKVIDANTISTIEGNRGGKDNWKNDSIGTDTRTISNLAGVGKW